MGFLSDLFGGDESTSNTTSNNSTTNTAYETDRRNVASDYAVSLSGDNNTVDRSTSNLTQFFDSSNRSTTMNDSSDRSTNFFDASNHSTNFEDNSVTSTTRTTNTSDSSNRSTNFSDSSNRSVNISNTDFGSVGSALTLNSTMTTRALDVADGGIKGVIDALKLQTLKGQEMVSAAFDMARASGANSLGSSAAAIGLAKEAMARSDAAVQDAADGGQTRIMTMGLMLAGTVAIIFAMKR